MFFQDSTICVFGPIHSSHLWAAWEPGSQRGHLGVDPVKRFAVTVKEQDEGIFHGYNGGGIIMYIYIYNIQISNHWTIKNRGFNQYIPTIGSSISSSDLYI